ncbi:hypothetical protein KCP91_16280 [Microvirga sp. SRT01]|uniref:Uncharacterized protein n=1 Tax=Sphingomonas longa TaxID=2778730 RepID=A0ABS2DAH2_9SPHN|nr:MULTISPECIES: hypothetical protein [Alphaproteobacteria]MBM6577943.1 hypothetical protein [Sphingomonas sp. BT552]MBR7710984.1 hypothetical protein [Microvirga sp. SRT01]
MPRKLSPARVRELETDLSARLTPADHASAGGFLHFCDEWDGLLIDQTDDEFQCCSCQFSDEFDENGHIRAVN